MKKLFLLTAVIFAASVNIYSQTAEEWKKIGNVALDSADYDKAIECYKKAIEVDSNYFDAYHNLGLAYSNKEEFDTAIEYYTKAVELNDTAVSTIFSLGFTYAEQEDFDKAIEMLKKGIEIQPNSPAEHYFLGHFYLQKDNPTYALMYFKKAAKLGYEPAKELLIENVISWEDTFEKPDYDKIKQNIEDKESNFYYQKLWDRYKQGDSTMNLEEKRHLYYGYVFNKNYSPYGSAYDSEKANAILDKEKPTKKEWQKLISLLDVALAVEPFGLRYLYYQMIAYKNIDKPKEAEKNDNKIRLILDALYSTGDALSQETAIHVIAVYNEYDYLYLQSLSSKGQALIRSDICLCDVLYLLPNEEGLEEMWFDVSQSFNSLNKLFEK